VSSSKNVLKNMLEFGIDLALESEDENIFYALEFAQFVQEAPGFDSVMRSESEIEIYNVEGVVLTVMIADGVLTIEPHTEEGAFDAVLLVLQFISEMHNEVKEKYTKLSIEETSDVTIEEGSESEDDSEWI
jgi:hypothetical protein